VFLQLHYLLLLMTDTKIKYISWAQGQNWVYQNIPLSVLHETQAPCYVWNDSKLVFLCLKMLSLLFSLSFTLLSLFFTLQMWVVCDNNGSKKSSCSAQWPSHFKTHTVIPKARHHCQCPTLSTMLSNLERKHLSLCIPIIQFIFPSSNWMITNVSLISL
jgi:hypothetical protein